jgi:hypothetical protein
MLIAIPFCESDASDALALLNWIEVLGGARPHSCLLVLDAGVEWSVAQAMADAATKSFNVVNIVATEEPVIGWPAGPNALWLLAARFALLKGEPFLWLEPDCVPLSPGWLEKLVDAYKKLTPGSFMGHLYKTNSEKFPPVVLSGIAIYPPGAIYLVEPALSQFQGRAWDIASTYAIQSYWHHTPLIYHFWGKPGLAPTFRYAKDQHTPENTFTLADIPQGAVLFHRNKDGTLLNILRGVDQVAGAKTLVVVLPVCNADANLMLKNLDWMRSMGMPRTHECLVSSDRTTMDPILRRIKQVALGPFLRVHETSYTLSRKVVFRQTAAWQHAANVMAQMNRNWLWLEADCVPLKSHWLVVMQKEYDRCGKAFCGPIMHGPGHMNGTAIYPANTPKLVPRTMSHTNNAWDVEARDEIGRNVHDCTKLWQCAWGVVRGKLDPISGEELPGFPKGNAIINQVRNDAVLFHRDKSGTLIDRLRERL